MDSNQKEIGAAPECADKPLGRGLQDISHLFLSSKAGGVGASQNQQASAEVREQRSAPSGTHSRTVLLKPCASSLSRDSLTGVFREMHGALEEGLRVIDTCVPCHPYGQIDLFALDVSNQLAIIDFETFAGDSLLLRGMSHFDWVMHNFFNIRRMYASESINVLAQPRLFLLAPQFSALMASVARHITAPRIAWMQYHLVDASGALGVLFERKNL